MSDRTETCPSCHSVVDAGQAGGFLHCGNCGERFPRPRRRPRARQRTPDDLDIHPALAKKYRKREGDDDLPSVELSPSLMEETDEPRERVQPAKRLKDTRPLRHSAPNPAAPGPPPADDLPKLPGMRIVERVGKGAMGAVYRAVEEETGKMVAVKVLAPELAARQDFIARFEREATALARVKHPGVVSTLRSGKTEGPHEGRPGNVGASDGVHYMLMEFVEGSSLRRVLDDRPLPPGRAFRFARQIAQGLGAAHEVGVIHRDLKPENILVMNADEEGEERLVLVDFGLAGIVDEEEDPHPNLTKSRMTMGTVNYMAPEQRTDAKRVDHRADLYAAGVILYELLTGDLPLGRFKLPTEHGQILPPAIDDVIVRALARAPDGRYQSAEEFDGALAAIEGELTAAAARDTVVGQTATMTRIVMDELESAPTVLSTTRAADTEADADAAPTPTPEPTPEWHTAPPWVRRPELVWGIVALAAGAIVGVAVGPGGLFERVGGHEAPALSATADGYGPGFDSEVTWEADEPGWRLTETDVRFDGAPTGVLTFARAPKREGPVYVAATALSVAGVGVVDDKENGVVVLVEDSGCRAARVEEGAPKPGVPVPCEQPLQLSCDAHGWCEVGTTKRRIEVPALSGQPRAAALVCAGRGCAFQRP
jgi:serine/threonine protein kinase